MNHFTISKKKLLKNNFPYFSLRWIAQTNSIKSYGQVLKYMYITVSLEKKLFFILFYLEKKNHTTVELISPWTEQMRASGRM